MSQHPSLKGPSAGAKHRNVLKRYERIRTLNEREKWGDRKSIYNLPKLKMIKLKMKKTKGPDEGAEGTGEAAGADKAKAETQKASAAKPAGKSKGKA